MGGLVYFSSGSGNTARFVERLGLPATRLPLKGNADVPELAEPFVLICPTYADGAGRSAVAKPVIRFLNVEANRSLLCGVIASGNRNFGQTFAMAGQVIARKCNVPLLYRFELAGTETDIARVHDGLQTFWGSRCLTPA
ncbi:protein involved in ribonucleotide reduction [Roseivivax halotolerans]|uniref:Protein NrdI n=1 Tax=Roseivivax halotolerans TaxID=93684 RepID=A0A1I6AG76_9RHOB|nr:class Ib ribonucleoside-diphosphate reductase assembly flavoprotein NrdI [Roseivivax halotolerans]SFQ67652.1 protein involved in ribonucleotide reduction [Roseivivax halotolerans]